MSLLLSICALHFVAQLSPGPDILLIAKTAAASSRLNALKVVAGISTGIVLWVVLTLAGFSALVQQLPWIQQVLMVIGGLFLAKMGWAMLLGGWATYRKSAPAQLQTEQIAEVKHYFLLGLMTNLANPKALIYFSSVFSLALSSAASEALKLQLALIIPVQTFMTFALLMLLLSQARMKTLYQAAAAYIDIISGVLFLIFAVWLCVDAVLLF